MPTFPPQKSTGENPAAYPSSEYILVCRAQTFSLDVGTWQFSLERADGTSVLDASDDDTGDLNRLTLLAAVRGLEAIDGASSVTMISHNRYVIRSLSDSLPRWRDNGFVWEHFGQRIDVQHADLWRRVDRALAIHRVEACLIASRLISTGSGQHSNHEGLAADSDDAVQLRLDAPHRVADPVGNRRTRGARPVADSGLPADGIRRWLLGAAASSQSLGSGRRFTAADLAGTT